MCTGDQQGRRKGRIAAREYAGDASLERDRVDLESSGRRDRDSVFGLDKRQVRRLADGEDHAVGVNDTAIVLVKLRPEAARIIEYFDAFDQFDSDRAAVAADDSLGAPSGQKSDSFVARDIEFLAALRGFHRRHLGLGLKTGDRNFE